VEDQARDIGKAQVEDQAQDQAPDRLVKHKRRIRPVTDQNADHPPMEQFAGTLIRLA
jgi:hypothetical protein